MTRWADILGRYALGLMVGLLGLAAAPAACAADAQPGWQPAPSPDERVLSLTHDAPRPFGVLTGDRVTQRITVRVAKPYKLQRSSLPPAHWINDWLELRAAQVRHRESEHANRYDLRLDYQIFRVPRVVELETIEGIALRFAGRGDQFAVRTADWRFSVSPLLEPEAGQEGIVDIPFRADAEPPSIDTGAQGTALVLFGAGGAMIAVLLAYLNGLWPWGRGAGPFARAQRQLRALRRADAPLEAGFRSLHRAFNETAGEAVFAERLERFFERQPAFVSARATIETFFERSRHLFFGEGRAGAQDDLAWLESVCRQCRNAERGVT